jgi:mono/diheme cytochrome c family protein
MRALHAVPAAVLVLAALAGGSPTAHAATAAEQRGRDIAQRLCASCHAIGRADRSPHAAAPPFRRLEPRVDLDARGGRRRAGLIAGHPEMPVFRLTRQEAASLVRYLKSIRAD